MTDDKMVGANTFAIAKKSLLKLHTSTAFIIPCNTYILFPPNTYHEYMTANDRGPITMARKASTHTFAVYKYVIPIYLHAKYHSAKFAVQIHKDPANVNIAPYDVMPLSNYNYNYITTARLST